MNTKPGIIGKKLGMTQLYKEDGTVQRVTVVDTSSLIVVGKRTKEKDGYTAVIFGLTDAKEKHLTKAQQGAFKKTNVAPKRTIQELRCDDDFAAKFEISPVRSWTRRASPGAAASPASSAAGASPASCRPTVRTSTAATAARSVRT
jgi:hypothetical protein